MDSERTPSTAVMEPPSNPSGCAVVGREAAAAKEPANAPVKPLICDPPELASQLQPILGEIRQLRRRPLFVLISTRIDENTCTKVFDWRRELRALGGSVGLDVVIHSPGGVLSDCYTIARALSRFSASWHALVPSMAASGATLICLGSETLVMCPVAQLGPLDPQVISKRSAKFFASERQSPLEAFQAARYLREFSLSTLDYCMRFLLNQMVTPQHALDTAAEIAVEFVRPILSKIEPYDLGALSLDSDVSIEYCRRIATPSDGTKRTQRNVNFTALVEKYPAHEFVIDLEEALTLGFTATAAEDDLEDQFHALRKALSPLDEYECVGLLGPDEVAQ